MGKKYKLTKEKIEFDGKTLYRIKACKSFGFVSEGDLGGFIETEDNLSQEGNCWVYDDAMVGGNARVCGNSWIYGDAHVFDDVRIYDYAEVYGNARVHGNAQIYGYAQVYGDARVYGDAEISEKQKINTGYIDKLDKSIKYQLMAQVGVCPINDKVILYKKVNKIKKGKYSSCYDSKFIYQDNKIAKVNNPDMSNEACSNGIHLSTPFYWSKGDTIIACGVDVKDIITIQRGKVRVKKCKVIGEVYSEK